LITQAKRENLDEKATSPDLILMTEKVFPSNNLICSQLQIEAESQDYAAATFSLNQQRIQFRAAKITPTKVGQFVTFWKRTNNGPIQPYDLDDAFDFLIVSTRKGNLFGQFVFPKSILRTQKIISDNGKGGKRAIRVYPPWDKTSSKQAQQTQQWQLRYFVEIAENNFSDHRKFAEIFSEI
jgi:hypothetical protein